MNEENKKEAPRSRPLILEIEDAKTGISASVNKALKRLPCYIVADILAGVYAQTREGARRELEIERAKEAQKEDEHG